MVTNQISLNSFLIARVLGTVACLLVVVSIGWQGVAYWTGHDSIYGLVPLFYVDAERNIPTFFSTFLLLFSALLLTVIAMLQRNQKATYVLHWATLALGFLLMAADEILSQHERLVEPMRKLLGDGHLGVFYFAWIIPGIILLLVLALFFLKFLLHLPAKTRLAFLIAATLYIGGAIGFELVGGRYSELHGTQNFMYSMIATTEESLEMAGVIVFIWALLTYITDHYKDVRFRFD